MNTFEFGLIRNPVQRRNYYTRIGGGAAALTAVVLSNTLVQHVRSDNAHHEALPGCEIVAKPYTGKLGSHDSTMDQIRQALHNPDEGVTVYQPDGRTLVGPEIVAAPQFTLQPGMKAEAPHVNPSLCKSVGGIVINQIG